MQKGYMENCTSLHLQVVWPRHRSSRCHNKHRERKPLVKAPKKLQQQQGTMGRHSPKGSYQRLKRQKGQRQKPPNTALKHMLSFLLPRFCIRFLWSQPDEFRVAKFFLGAGLGSLFALGLSEVLIFPMSITEDHKIQLMYGMAGVSALGWGTSPHFRCSSLLVVPKFLGREGRVYILTYVLASIYDGPVANVRHNLGEVVRSISCTVELQIENVKRSWKVSLAPLRKVLRDMVMSGQILRAENKDVSRSFAALNAQVASQEGYSARRARAAARKGRPSTQEAYETKTRMRCTYIIRKAIVRCQTWFSDKHRSCMRTIAVPLVSHLLCLPMKFSFLCHLAQIMHTWCRNKIPVEGNFGQTYDRVNGSIDNLNQDFSATLVVKEEQQAMLVGANLSHRHLVDDVNEQITQNSRRFSTVMSVLRVLLSCTFVFIFASYNQDIRFDNLYISRYFRLIDARRRKQKKRTLLPLRRAERSGVIDPYRLRFQPAESKNVMLELLGCMPTLVFLLLVCSLDSLLYTVFNTIRHHSFVEYSFRSSHHLEVKVGGQTMMARLLRSTIGALNTSSETAMEATNVGPDCRWPHCPAVFFSMFCRVFARSARDDQGAVCDLCHPPGRPDPAVLRAGVCLSSPPSDRCLLFPQAGEEAYPLPLQRNVAPAHGLCRGAAEAHHPACPAAQETGEAPPGSGQTLAPIPAALPPPAVHPLQLARNPQLLPLPQPGLRHPLLPPLLAGHGAGLLCLQPGRSALR
ncbi:E3 ubiquitin-protein ligase DCST1 isoform X3 [Hemicordylus capensis]|uniref:E3 ubiquitin-protein ligase DCST1 isoform X3 n=1 Tax=Hemicordylus capensis TaxID=884348 RepID=UPI002304BA2C|nr:E3 ubiquitin-protein ligase DCST1 isoform X3 [Hemicordylus capensis]